MAEKRSPLEIEGIKIEKRLVRALERAIPKIRRSIPLYQLTAAIKTKNIRRAMALVKREAIADALAPCATITSDAVVKGGKIIADQVNGSL